MIQNSTEAIHQFEDVYQRWALAKRDGKLSLEDEEPTGTNLGLDDWVTRQIKNRIDREISRPC